MSTPVSVEPPPRAHLRTDSEQERDLSAKIQRMITLQYEEQHMSSRSEVEDGDECGNGNYLGAEGDEDLRSTIGMPKQTIVGMTNLNSWGYAAAATSGGQMNAEPAAPEDAQKTPWPSQRAGIQGLLPPPPNPQMGVGRGTMVFSSNYDANHRRMSSGEEHQGMVSMPMAMPMNTHKQQQQVQQQQQTHPFPPRQNYSGYGALDTTTGSTMGAQRGDLSLPEDQRAQLQEHEFFYGNPDLRNPYYAVPGQKEPHRYRPQDSICAKFCCLYAPIANLFLQENVHRSFCYGSIDGMLTGSGIVSAFCAIQVLSSHAEWEVRLAVLAFTTAACVADAVCMAMSHVWTSFIVSSGHAQERNRERKQLDTNKGDAKARLVDMLLGRGMLKIDAMSLADTLEGYPDMFVSALVGDSLLAGTEFAAEDETDDGLPHHHHQQQQLLPLGGGGGDNSAGSLVHGFESWKFPSYAQFNEVAHEPETGNLSTVIKASQVEGFFMMLGFSIFAIIPSLLWLVLPLLVVPDVPEVKMKGDMLVAALHPAAASTGQVIISLPSLVVSLSGLLMWFLGVWKSRFMETNWMMSGIENVVVLLACVITAYGVGFALCYAMGGNEGLTLSNVVQSRI